MKPTAQLAALCGGDNIPHVTGEPMKNYTTFKIGGKAELIIKPASVEQLQRVLSLCHSAGVTPLIVGNGSDLLVCDAGISRPVIQIGSAMAGMRVDGEKLTCGAGASLAKLCTFAAENSFTGLEFAYGIPGNVGGAVYMDAGAYGGEMKDVVCEVFAVSPQGELKSFTTAECDFSYRHSVFAQNGYCITAVSFMLKRGEKTAVKARMSELMQRRTDKQPLEYPSAGSTFKRPEGGYASELIDRCGLKGRRFGGAMVSEKHAGFLINYENATCADMLALIKLVQDEVREKTGFSLECEIKYIDE